MRNQVSSGHPWVWRFAVSFFLCLGLAPTIARGQQHSVALPANYPVQVAQQPVATQPAQQSLTLADCIAIGLQRQPALIAQQASVAAADSQRRALDNMVCASLLSREMTYRKQQACLGVTVAVAGLETAQWETIYSVTRCYYTVIYARKQELVAKGLLDKLEVARKNADAMVKKGDPDSVVTKVDVDKLEVNIDLVQLKLIEASTGVERATAALREAMGVHHDAALPLVLMDFPGLDDNADVADLVQLALSRRGEMVQASCAAQITELEVCAQNNCGLLPFKISFAAASDVHSRPIPQGMANGTYRPGAIGIEMPTLIVGRKADRVARAQDFNVRAGSVVEKTQNLIALEAQDAFYKWQAAAGQVKILRESVVKSAKLADVISGRFDNGKVSGEDYLRARTLEESTQAQLNEALFNHALALAALERVTAGGFTPSYRRVAAIPR
jgi:outer membrane protein TolC